MIIIRKGMFETNSSSCHTYIYDRSELVIPSKIYINTNDDKEIINYYYQIYENDFIAWLQKIGVKDIYINGEQITEIYEQHQQILLPNHSCEWHNADIGDEEIVKYNLFGTLIEEGHDKRTASDLCKKYKTNTNYVVSDWFV